MVCATESIWHHTTEVVAVCGVLASFAGIVATWVKMQMNVKQMREDFHQLLANHRVCSGKQQERWESTGQLIAAACQDTKILNADLRSEIKVLEQKLDDYIRWAKNGGKDNVG